MTIDKEKGTNPSQCGGIIYNSSVVESLTSSILLDCCTTRVSPIPHLIAHHQDILRVLQNVNRHISQNKSIEKKAK